jgi:hypothetical protein
MDRRGIHTDQTIQFLRLFVKIRTHQWLAILRLVYSSYIRPRWPPTSQNRSGTPTISTPA